MARGSIDENQQPSASASDANTSFVTPSTTKLTIAKI